MLEKLQALGYMLTESEVMQIAGTSRSVGRLHVARALVKKGLVASVRDAFAKLLEHGQPAYLPHYRLTPEEAVKLIHDAGGMAVLAHPKLVKDEGIVERVLELGFDGLEAYYPRHTDLDTVHYKLLAEERGLRITGGSDYHATPQREPEHLGIFTVDDALAEPFYHPPKPFD